MESPQTQSEISITSWWSGNLQTMAIFLLSVNCALFVAGRYGYFALEGPFCAAETLQLHDDLGRINFSCILEAHRALRFRDSGATPTGSLRASPLHYPYARLSRQRLLLWPIESITLSFSPETLALWVPDIARSLRIRSTPTAVASSSVVI